MTKLIFRRDGRIMRGGEHVGVIQKLNRGYEIFIGGSLPIAPYRSWESTYSRAKAAALLALKEDS